MEEGAPPGIDSQAGLVQKLVQNQCFLSSCFYEDFASIWVTLWGTILVKNRKKCVAKTSLREVVKRVRKKEVILKVSKPRKLGPRRGESKIFKIWSS